MFVLSHWFESSNYTLAFPLVPSWHSENSQSLQNGRADWWRFSLGGEKPLWIRISSQPSKWLLMTLLYNMLPLLSGSQRWCLAHIPEVRILLLFWTATTEWTLKSKNMHSLWQCKVPLATALFQLIRRNKPQM